MLLEDGIITLITKLKTIQETLSFILNLMTREHFNCKQDNCTGIMKFKKNSNHLNKGRLKCERCRIIICVNKYFDDNLPRIPLLKVIICGYFYAYKISNWRAVGLLKLNEKTFIKLKRIFINLARTLIEGQSKIGGPGRTIQVDETACNRRRLIYNPTTQAQEIRGTVWVIGAICESTGEVRLEVLPDRSIESISGFFERNVAEGTFIKTDGYPSYPEAVRRVNCRHSIINHNVGFVNENGEHTNTIESVWASLKIEIRNRRGVIFSSLPEFIREYETMLRVLGSNNTENCERFFFQLMRLLFN